MSDDFWSFSLEVYGKPGVETALLALQDDFGFDVNLLLFCVYCAKAGHGRLSQQAQQEMAEIADVWGGDIVAPLRAVRRALKTPVAGASGAVRAPLREDVKRVELAAEHAMQRLLAGLISGPASRPVDASDAWSNLEAYAARQGQEFSVPLKAHLDILVNMTFSGA